MNINRIQILGVDDASKSRGVGRYVEAILAMTQDMTVGGQDIVINPFFSVFGNRIESINFPKKALTVAVVHDLIPLKYKDHFPLGILGRIKQTINKGKLKQYNRIVTDSNASAKDIHDLLGIPLEMLTVIYPFSTLSSDKNTQSKRPDGLPPDITKNGFALYVGDVNWHKNIVSIAQACLSSKLPLVVVGKSFEMLDSKIDDHKELDELRKFQKIYRENARGVCALGYVGDTELAWLYENALANILLSHDEGFGYSYVEAAHFGTPSVLSNIPIFRETSGSKGAFFVDQNSQESICLCLVKLKNSPELRHAAGLEAATRSILFSKEKFRADWQKVLSNQALNAK